MYWVAVSSMSRPITTVLGLTIDVGADAERLRFDAYRTESSEFEAQERFDSSSTAGPVKDVNCH